MGTIIRPELSVNNQYWVEKHRYYELKHFCLQYPMWKKTCNTLDGWQRTYKEMSIITDNNTPSDPTAICAESREYYSKRIELVERVAVEVAKDLSDYILKGVTEGVSYNYLKTKLEIPCCKDTYYLLYRKFFYLLSKQKD